MRKSLLTIAFVAAVLGGSQVAAGDDHDEARRAVEANEILPLRDILDRAEAAYPGRLIEAELDYDDGLFVYEIKLLTKDGRVVELDYDARTGELLKIKDKRG